MSDDPKLLRAEADYYHGEWQKAAAKIEKLRAALKLFADEASVNKADDDYFIYGGITIGHLRAAAAAYRETDND